MEYALRVHFRYEADLAGGAEHEFASELKPVLHVFATHGYGARGADDGVRVVPTSALLAHQAANAPTDALETRATTSKAAAARSGSSFREDIAKDYVERVVPTLRANEIAGATRQRVLTLFRFGAIGDYALLDTAFATRTAAPRSLVEALGGETAAREVAKELRTTYEALALTRGGTPGIPALLYKFDRLLKEFVRVTGIAASTSAADKTARTSDKDVAETLRASKYGSFYKGSKVIGALGDTSFVVFVPVNARDKVDKFVFSSSDVDKDWPMHGGEVVVDKRTTVLADRVEPKGLTIAIWFDRVPGTGVVVVTLWSPTGQSPKKRLLLPGNFRATRSSNGLIYAGVEIAPSGDIDDIMRAPDFPASLFYQLKDEESVLRPPAKFKVGDRVYFNPDIVGAAPRLATVVAVEYGPNRLGRMYWGYSIEFQNKRVSVGVPEEALSLASGKTGELLAAVHTGVRAGDERASPSAAAYLALEALLEQLEQADGATASFGELLEEIDGVVSLAYFRPWRAGAGVDVDDFVHAMRGRLTVPRVYALVRANLSAPSLALPLPPLVRKALAAARTPTAFAREHVRLLRATGADGELVRLYGSPDDNDYYANTLLPALADADEAVDATEDLDDRDPARGQALRTLAAVRDNMYTLVDGVASGVYAEDAWAEHEARTSTNALSGGQAGDEETATVGTITNSADVKFTVVRETHSTNWDEANYTLRLNGANKELGNVKIIIDDDGRLHLASVFINDKYEATQIRGTRLCTSMATAALNDVLEHLDRPPAFGFVDVESAYGPQANNCYLSAFENVGYEWSHNAAGHDAVEYPYVDDEDAQVQYRSLRSLEEYEEAIADGENVVGEWTDDQSEAIVVKYVGLPKRKRTQAALGDALSCAAPATADADEIVVDVPFDPAAPLRTVALPGAERLVPAPSADGRARVRADASVSFNAYAETATHTGQLCRTRAGEALMLVSELLATTPSTADSVRAEWQVTGDVPLAKGFIDVRHAHLVARAADAPAGTPFAPVAGKLPFAFADADATSVFHEFDQDAGARTTARALAEHLDERVAASLNVFFGSEYAPLAVSKPHTMARMHCPLFTTTAGTVWGSLYALRRPARPAPASYWRTALATTLVRNDARADHLLAAMRAQAAAPATPLASSRYIAKIAAELDTVYANAFVYLDDFTNEGGRTYIATVADSAVAPDASRRSAVARVRLVRRGDTARSRAVVGLDGRALVNVVEDYKDARLGHGDDCEGVAKEIYTHNWSFHDSDLADAGDDALADLLRGLHAFVRSHAYVPALVLAEVTNKKLDTDAISDEEALAHTYDALIRTDVFLDSLVDADAHDAEFAGLTAAVHASDFVRARAPEPWHASLDAVLVGEGTARSSVFVQPLAAYYPAGEELEVARAAAARRAEAQMALIEALPMGVVSLDIPNRHYDDALASTADRSDFYKANSAMYVSAFSKTGVLDFAFAAADDGGSELTHGTHFNDFVATRWPAHARLVPYNRLNANDGAVGAAVLAQLEPVPALKHEAAVARGVEAAATPFDSFEDEFDTGTGSATGAATAHLLEQPGRMPGVPRSIVLSVRAEDATAPVVAAVRAGLEHARAHIAAVHVHPRYLSAAPVHGDETSLPPVVLYELELRLT